jgi:hypothetical protein
MTWATWRQHRAEALASLALLALTATFVGYAGTQRMFSDDALRSAFLMIGLAMAPALGGVFIGAPLLARDLEQGTHRLVWTQGTTRARWLWVKLLLLFGAALPAGAVLGGMTAAVVATQPDQLANPWFWFDESGPAFAAYVAFALALGVAAGAVLRRTYPAMAVTLVLFVAVRVVVGALFRPNYLPPLRVPMLSWGMFSIPERTPWTLGVQLRDARGRSVSVNEVLNLISRHHGDTILSHYGIVAWLPYQPGGRFWLFQGIETAIFGALATLLVAFTAYWVLRRAEG